MIQDNQSRSEEKCGVVFGESHSGDSTGCQQMESLFSTNKEYFQKAQGVKVESCFLVLNSQQIAQVIY